MRKLFYASLLMIFFAFLRRERHARCNHRTIHTGTYNASVCNPNTCIPGRRRLQAPATAQPVVTDPARLYGFCIPRC